MKFKGEILLGLPEIYRPNCGKFATNDHFSNYKLIIIAWSKKEEWYFARIDLHCYFHFDHFLPHSYILLIQNLSLLQYTWYLYLLVTLFFISLLVFKNCFRISFSFLYYYFPSIFYCNQIVCVCQRILIFIIYFILRQLSPRSRGVL